MAAVPRAGLAAAVRLRAVLRAGCAAAVSLRAVPCAGRAAAARLPAAVRVGRRWGPHALTIAAVLAALYLAVGGIASQLAGRTVLADTDAMVASEPYANVGFAGAQSKNLLGFDLYTSELPAESLFADSVRSGHPAAWDPYVVGGTPLGGITNNALASPLTAPFYVLPTWLAPAYERLAEIVVGLTGFYLFLRRLRLSPPAAVVGGMAYVSGAFMVTWQGWPQTRVAAFIPLVFWATERVVAERRVRDVALLAVTTAAMLLGGFPAVEGYALLTVGCYALVRTRKIKTLAALGLGLAGAVGLAMVQLLPFAKFYGGWLIEGRGQTDSSHLNPVSLVTSFAPWAFGGVGSGDSQSFILDTNAVESLSYVGAAVLVLVVVAIAAQRNGRALLPRGVWVFFAAATVVWLDLVYRGGVLLTALQHTPLVRSLFDANFIGRARSLTGFLLASLAAVGFELILRRRGEVVRERGWWPALVLMSVSTAVVWLIWRGRKLAVADGTAGSLPGHTAVATYDAEVRGGLLLLALAVLLVVMLWIVRRQAVRVLAAVGVLVLIAVQGVSFIDRYTPSAEKSTFYPVTDTQQYLAAHLGHQRYAATADAIVQGADPVYGLRALNGHAFLSATLATLLRGLPYETIPHPTLLYFGDNPLQATSPILDRLGVSYYAAAPNDHVFGTPIPASSDGTTLTLQPNVPVTVSLPVSTNVRAVGFVPTGLIGATAANDSVEVSVDGVSAKRLLTGIRSGAEFDVPIALDSVANNGTLAATITLHSAVPVQVQARAGSVALSEVVAANDGLQLVYSGSSVIYERLNALPRVRWASASVVVPDEAARVRLLASGSLPSSTVVVNNGTPLTDGGSGTVDVTSDGTDSISTTVTASGRGYLVVADADQTGWSVTVDGKRASLVHADEGMVAVAVPAGRHVVTLQYSSPDGGVGAFVSGATACALVAGVVGEAWWLRRRRGREIGVGAAAEVGVLEDVVSRA